MNAICVSQGTDSSLTCLKMRTAIWISWSTPIFETCELKIDTVMTGLILTLCSFRLSMVDEQIKASDQFTSSSVFNLNQYRAICTYFHDFLKDKRFLLDKSLTQSQVSTDWIRFFAWSSSLTDPCASEGSFGSSSHGSDWCQDSRLRAFFSSQG